MIMEEIITETCERLNLTSDTARSRVARELNNRYKRITSSIGLVTSRFTQVPQTAEIGNRTMTFSGIEKITCVVDKNDPKQDVVLTQITTDEMHITPPRTNPRHYAVTRMHGNTVDIELDCTPTQTAASAVVAAGGTGYSVGDTLSLSGGTETSLATFIVASVLSGVILTVTLGEAGLYTELPADPTLVTGGTGTGCTLTVTWNDPFTLYADGYVNVSTLSGSDIPDFPESFHDILIWGAMADEYRKMEKLPLMQDAEANYEKRLSDLRMFIAKSSYLDIYQGRYSGKVFRWTRDSQLLWD
jgi:hypothetical protein